MTGSSEYFVIKLIIIVTFSGSQEDWLKWKTNFIVEARVNKYYIAVGHKHCSSKHAVGKS